MSSSEGENYGLDNISGSESDDFIPKAKVRKFTLLQPSGSFRALDKGRLQDKGPGKT